MRSSGEMLAIDEPQVIPQKSEIRNRMNHRQSPEPHTTLDDLEG
jgi:hypothetical protein